MNEANHIISIPSVQGLRKPEQQGEARVQPSINNTNAKNRSRGLNRPHCDTQRSATPWAYRSLPHGEACAGSIPEYALRSLSKAALATNDGLNTERPPFDFIVIVSTARPWAIWLNMLRKWMPCVRVRARPIKWGLSRVVGPIGLDGARVFSIRFKWPRHINHSFA